jgi:hypothetical protein
MSSAIEDMAEAILARAVADSGARRPTLQAVIRLAGDMLAESHGHDLASATFAPLARKHAEQATREGVVFGRGRK